MGNTTKPRHVYVGSYTSENRDGKGTGISIYTVESLTGNWIPFRTVTAENPTFLCYDKTKRFLYSCQGDGSLVSAYAIKDDDGDLSFLGTRLANGINGVHLLPDPTNRFIIVISSVVDVFPILEDGSLGPANFTLRPEGDFGPLKEQIVYCPHQGVFDPSGRFLLVPDKNLDGIHILRFDPGTGKLEYHDPKCARSRPGAGQRHLDWHPDGRNAYVIDENDNTVTVWEWDGKKGTLTPVQCLPSIPPDYFNLVKGGRDYGSGEIWVAPSGRFVYASNRGHDSIVTYAVDGTSGRLSLVGWTDTQGKTPRFFCLDSDGKRLYVANLNGHTVVKFRLDKDTGKPIFTGWKIEVGSPCCVLFR